ncbi:uncharacterized mitochondrial protein AtMg00810-like [Rutidosis leptorrhynchoides]|uniref:uncharacterized mitochondrial protein AtMg00810-like n=1 Tax=Rutidosis leptorrhynchoides TaxID=125765 RepID=UPI003A9962D9
MRDEYNALIKNHTWTLVPRPMDANIVRSMWLFRHKYNADGTLSRYKASLVANGRSQQIGIDCDETFSPVVKPATIRTAPGAWFQRFAGYATRAGFVHSHCDSSLFIYQQGSEMTYLLLYVDDIVLTASSPAFLRRIIQSLHQKFSMIDLGPLNYFLGISVMRNSTSMFLSQRKYATEILERAGMLNCKPCRTPMETNSKLGTNGPAVSDPTLYRSLAGVLQYLTFTRPDITYGVQQLCIFMHDPREPHLAALRRILRYIRGTLDLGLQLFASSTASLVAYSDADWAGCPSTRRSTSGYCVFLGNNLYLGHLSDNTHLLDLVWRQSIGVLLMRLLKLVGYGIFFASFIVRYSRPLWYTVIM